jgi:hypothetical protein
MRRAAVNVVCEEIIKVLRRYCTRTWQSKKQYKELMEAVVYVKKHGRRKKFYAKGQAVGYVSLQAGRKTSLGGGQQHMQASRRQQALETVKKAVWRMELILEHMAGRSMQGECGGNNICEHSRQRVQCHKSRSSLTYVTVADGRDSFA